MSRTTTKSSFIPRLDPRSLDYSIIQNWASIQAESLSQTVQLIEADINKIALFTKNNQGVNNSDSALQNAIISFLRSKKTPTVLAKRLGKELSNLGLLIPIRDIKEIHPKDLKHGFNIISQLTGDFSFLEFVDHLREIKSDATKNAIPSPMEGAFYLLEKYINQILHSDSLVQSVAHLENWFVHYIPYQSGLMKGQQVLVWLAQVFDSVITNTPMNVHKFEYSDAVTRLINNYQSSLISELQEVKSERNKKFYFASFLGIKQEIIDLIEEDYEDLLIYESLKRIKIYRDADLLPLWNKAFYEENFAQKIGKLFNRKKVVNAIRSVIFTENSIHDLSLFDTNLRPYTEINNRLSYLSQSDKKTIRTYGNEQTAESVSFSKSVSESKEDYLLSLSNIFLKPYGVWTKSDNKFYPKINFADNRDRENALFFLKSKKAHEAEEAELLKKYIASIKIIQTRTSLDNLVKSVPQLFYRSNQKRWAFAIKEAEEAIKQRAAFRRLKMKELGIDLDTKYTDAQKDVFLTEMLTIEDEIQRFVPFVTSSFQSALPSKKTVEFNAYRHVSDGVEFDPETVHDPEKWIRGNVMKTLKHKIKKGEVTQVNCFCLDLSGSMDYHRMRNLYKVLFLLVTGLQSRKSYDAFHFFSNTFIPGVDFTGEFTRKNLLFRVLTIISRVEGPRVVYEGLEGTNISDGIMGCIDSMQSFVQKLKSKTPNVNLSCSLFVITDGEPSLGVTNLKGLNRFVEDQRTQTNFAIKAIYIKSKTDKNNFITTIFGNENAVESSSFEEGVQKFTSIMTKTYRQQRQDFKWEKKRARLKGKI